MLSAELALTILDYKDIKTFDPKIKADLVDNQIFIWLMTNYWETNFNAGLGGFYEFDFYLKYDESYKDPKTAITECHLINTGIKSFRLGE